MRFILPIVFAAVLAACGTKTALTMPPGPAKPPILGNPTPPPAPKKPADDSSKPTAEPVPGIAQ
jgi:hypothetical protein